MYQQNDENLTINNINRNLNLINTNNNNNHKMINDNNNVNIKQKKKDKNKKYRQKKALKAREGDVTSEQGLSLDPKVVTALRSYIQRIDQSVKTTSGIANNSEKAVSNTEEEIHTDDIIDNNVTAAVEETTNDEIITVEEPVNNVNDDEIITVEEPVNNDDEIITVEETVNSVNDDEIITVEEPVNSPDEIVINTIVKEISVVEDQTPQQEAVLDYFPLSDALNDSLTNGLLISSINNRINRFGYIEYEVSIELLATTKGSLDPKNTKMVILRRYNDFYVLNALLIAAGVSTPQLPRRQFFKFLSDKHFMDERQRGLDAWLKVIIKKENYQYQSEGVKNLIKTFVLSNSSKLNSNVSFLSCPGDDETQN